MKYIKIAQFTFPLNWTLLVPIVCLFNIINGCEYVCKNAPALLLSEKVVTNDTLYSAEIDAIYIVSKYKKFNTTEYIISIKKAALNTQEKTGIPASITISQGIIESNRGNSTLARKYNNHFGIKCFKKNCKPNHCVQYEDDKPTDRFLIFKEKQGSFDKHARLLTGSIYNSLLGSTSKEWAIGLQAKGYATNKKYKNLLLSIIKTHNLEQYDREQFN